ncbi:hypothetical protein CTAYLR_006214 [Chrysophaeum taylorii]|uniref:Fe2OG dioxygenase domain-containing protein n=1 Tax=Chrysophaeum taylorii TaxID=2483200 RepID=A0AAD7U8Q4_9STRA|nr:hypothetical protein CTAYLR_006214 [Chrysophaeum taylorii]
MLLFIFCHLATAGAALVIDASAGQTIFEGGVHREENFAPPRLLDDLQVDIAALGEAGHFELAGPDMRHAEYCDPVDRPPVGDWDAFFALWERLDMVRDQLQPELGPMLPEIELHYVRYPKGGYYSRHVDDFETTEPRRSRRRVSFVAYLTPAWTDHDGGYLRVFYGDRYADIPPLPGSLVLFDSYQIHHEVLPTNNERFCLIGWFHTPCDALKSNCTPTRRERHEDDDFTFGARVYLNTPAAAASSDL